MLRDNCDPGPVLSPIWPLPPAASGLTQEGLSSGQIDSAVGICYYRICSCNGNDA